MSGLDAYPRVLVVGQPFDRTTGGGITLSNLFEGWPRERLAAVVVSDSDLTFDVCDHYYVLGTEEMTWSWPLSLVTRTETPPSRAGAAEASSTGAAVPAEDKAPSPARRAFRAALDGLGLADALRGMHLSTGLREWIRAFDPDVVYSQLSDLPVMTLVDEVLDDTDLPFALHVMDDWPDSMYRRGALAWVVRDRARRALGSLMRRAKSRMAIGDAMADEYLRRYGVPFVPIQNSVDLDRYDALASLHRVERDVSRARRLEVVYAGRVGRANSESLLSVARVVALMAADDVPVSLRLYTASTDHPAIARMSALQGVEVLPPVPYDHVPALLSAADVLLMPLDFDDEGTRFAGLSMPTKIPEYMAAGRPVLTYAPRGSAAAEYARTGGWSVLVDTPDSTLLAAALTLLAREPALREAMGARGRRLAIERHDASTVRARFAEELARAAAGPGARA